MAAPLDFSSQSVAEFCDTVSAETSAPGGGSVAAVTGAMGASLAAMAARFSKEQWEDAAGAVAQAEALKARLLPLAEEDARAYENVLLALRMPREVDEEVRDDAIGDALSRATDVPLAIAEASVDVATLACELAHRGNQNLQGDAAAAVFLAEAAVRASANLVEINLATREGDERLERSRELVEIVRRTSRRVTEPTG
jgi:glutamate formiminotransferase/formiminotetrahydrofolate cyclodeaminase